MSTQTQFPQTKSKVTTNQNLGFSLDKLTLYLKFKKKVASLDLNRCLKLLQNILLLSNSFREELIIKKKVGKKLNKTNRIRQEIQSLVNREGVCEEVISELISLIRQGRIENIQTTLNEQEIDVSSVTDFTQILITLLQKN